MATTPVLIFTDNDRIQNEKIFLDNSVLVFQAIYGALVSVGVTATIAEINNLVSWKNNDNGAPNFEKEFVINKLLDQAAPYVLNGVPLTREGVRNIMVEPDVSALVSALQDVPALYSHNPGPKGVRINLMTLVDGIISKTSTAYDSIANEFTYYTQSDASAALASSLKSVCDALNAHDATYQDAILIGFGFGKNTNSQTETSLKGIAIMGDTFVPELSYIRAFERTGNLFTGA